MTMERKAWKGRLVLVLVVLAINLVADQATKVWARETMKGEPPRSYLGGTVVLVYAENTGAFLSMGQDLAGVYRLLVLKLVPALAMAFALVWMLRHLMDLPRGALVAMACFIAGGLGNLWDRFVFGWVTDFLNFGIGTLRTGIVNLADISLTFGAVIWLLLMRKTPRPPRAEGEGPSA